MILIDYELGVESPMPKGNSARQIWKLKHRYYRLCNLADKHKGTCLNIIWLEIAGCIYDTLEHLKTLGVYSIEEEEEDYDGEEEDEDYS